MTGPEGPAKLALDRMKTRADFLHAQTKGCRQSRPLVGLELCPTPDRARRAGAVRLGVTASRKVGGAVQRNRAKRRLRAAAATVLPLYGREGHDYVLIARASTPSCPFAALLEDVQKALKAAHRRLERQTRPQTGGQEEPHG